MEKEFLQQVNHLNSPGADCNCIRRSERETSLSRETIHERKRSSEDFRGGDGMEGDSIRNVLQATFLLPDYLSYSFYAL